MSIELSLYADLLGNIKTRVRQAQVKATISANTEMILMYWDIGCMIMERQQHEGWGAGVIPRLSKDIRNDLPEVKGFSERNIGYMIRFAREYGYSPILQQAVAKLLPAENTILALMKTARSICRINFCHSRSFLIIIIRIFIRNDWAQSIEER